MAKRPKRGIIDGPFYPWLAEMGNSGAMRMLRKNSDAVNALTLFMTKYTLANNGKNLSVTYDEVKDFMAPATFAKAKFWCMALGFVHCTRFGRLERNASIYELSTKWRHLSNCPEKLGRIITLLHRHDRVARILIGRIRTRREIPPVTRKKMVRTQLEKRMLGQ
jgi:hypothetical protein